MMNLRISQKIVSTITVLMLVTLMLLPTSIGTSIVQRSDRTTPYGPTDTIEWMNDSYKGTSVRGPQVVWNRTFGTLKWDECSGIEQSSDGGFTFAGTTNANGYDNGGDCWLVHIDANGELLWQNSYGGASSDTGTDLCCTTDGGYGLIGYTRSYGAGGSDVYLIKTDANGLEQWNKTFGGTMDDLGLSIQQCGDGGFILAGLTQSYGAREAWLIKTDAAGAMQWQQRFCGTRPPGGYFVSVLRTAQEEYVAAGRNYLGQTSDIIVVKTTQDGTVLWEKLLGDANCKDAALGITSTSDGNYIITGQREHETTEHDILLMKINSDGEELWTRTFNETTYFDTGLSVTQTTDGGFLVAGEIGTAANAPTVTDAILIKTDGDGRKQWQMTLGGSGSEGFYDSLQTSDGGYIAGGMTTSYGMGSQDAWVLKFTAFENQPPDTPETPTGQASGKIRQLYVYTTQTEDPDGDELFYLWDWGDGTTSGWIGPYDSGVTCNTSHSWSKKGTYQIQVKAKDSYDAESNWGTLTVTMPCSTNIPFRTFLERFFEQFPHAFPILRQLIGY